MIAIKELLHSLSTSKNDFSNLADPNNAFLTFLFEVTQYLYTEEFFIAKLNKSKENFTTVLKETLTNTRIQYRWKNDIIPLFTGDRHRSLEDVSTCSLDENLDHRLDRKTNQIPDKNEVTLRTGL
jgi:hypothetical protein